MEGLVIFILLCVAGAVALSVINDKTKADAQRNIDDIRRANNAKATAFEQENQSVINKKLDGWQLQTPAHEDDRDGYIALGPNRSELAVYHCSKNRKYVDSDFRRVPLTVIRSVGIELTNKIGTKHHVERIPVTTQQKKSAGGRALIGAVALGPVGAVVGAASGLNKKTITSYKEVTRTSQVTETGPKILVIVISDFHKPILRLRCRTDHLTEEWAHRIEALLNTQQELLGRSSETQVLLPRKTIKL